MIRNLWLHRAVALLNAVALIFVVDGFIAAPLWSLAAGIVVLFFLLWEIQRPLILHKFSLTLDDVAVVRIVTFSIIFFIQCAILAWLILN
ncbi:MAG: hypothetical protein FJY65_05960 [Calditrichaeota bacterium]|nr:hypothetical protein [Calditrichota bacterium]